MSIPHDEEYHQYVKEKLDGLNPVFARAAVGDFSYDISTPDENDEFLQLYVGVQIMLEVIRDQLSTMKDLNQSLEYKVKERTHALVEAQHLAHIGSWEWDIKNNIVHWSDELFRIYDISKEDFNPSYEGFLERVFIDDKPNVQRVIEKAYKEGGQFEIQHRITISDGSIRTVRGRGQVILDDAGMAIKMYGTSQNITERLQAEEMFRQLLESAPDALVIVNERGAIHFVNSQTEAMFGYRRDKLLGQPIEVLIPSRFRNHHQTSRDGFFIEPRTRPMGVGIELYGLRSDSTEFPVEVSLSPLKTDKGTLVTAAIRDMSEKKKIENELRMTAQTIKSMNESVTITDMNNNIISINPAFSKEYGYTEEEVLGKNIHLIRSTLNPHGITEEILSRTMQDGWNGELINRKKSGVEFPIHLSTSVVRDQHGSPIALVGISRDITQQLLVQKTLDDTAKQRAEDLRHFSISIQQAQEEERRRIARELHDDLSQRLSGMKLHLELLVDDVPPKNKKLNERITKIKKLIDDMINETHRISANLHPSAIDDFGLMVALQLLFREFEASLKTPIEFHPTISTHEKQDKVVEIALYRIVQEALNNIVKHAQADSINIHLRRDTSGFLLSIQDNGIGFNIPEQKRKIKRGLGLISMKERTETVGGTFEISSTPGEGTKISVTIPV